MEGGVIGIFEYGFILVGAVEGVVVGIVVSGLVEDVGLRHEFFSNKIKL